MSNRRPAMIYTAADWPHFAGIDWVDNIMSVDVRDRLHEKQGRSIARWTLEASDGRRLVVYLKRHYCLSWLSGILSKLFPSRAWSPGMQEHRHLQTAAKLGVPVPRVVAAGEWRSPLQGMLAVEELTDMLALHEAIPLANRRLTSEQFTRWKSGLIGEMARLSRLMHDAGYYHRDLYLCHFYIHINDCTFVPEYWNGRLTMIDFHRFGRAGIGGFYQQAKDLAQLWYSTEGVEGMEPNDIVIFTEAYGRLGGLMRWLIRQKWRLYVRKSEQRASRREASKRAAA
jgi:hypothetical protein